MKPTYLFAKWHVKDGHLNEVLVLLKELASHSVKEKGNLHYIAHQSNADPNTILLYEGYESEAAVEAHRNSEHFKNLVLGKIVPMLVNREATLASKLELGV